MPRRRFPPQGDLAWDEFVRIFKPEYHRDGEEYGIGDEHGFFMYETYGRDLEYVQGIAQRSPGRVWTYMDDDEGNPMIGSGMHFVNRIGYLITKEAAPADRYYNVILDD